MSVSTHNWRMSSPLYHKQIYPTVIQTSGSIYDWEDIYPGYCSGFNPSGFMNSTWFARTTGIYDSTPYIDDNTVAGTISGADSNNWHSDIKVVATDNTNYAVGIMVVCCNTTLGSPTRYRLSMCVWNGTAWSCSQFGEYIRKNATDSTDVAFGKLPEYIYLTMFYNNGDYPTSGGIITTMLNNNDQEVTFWNSIGTFSSILIPQLRTAGKDTDVNPDPQPTPIKNDDPYSPGGNTWTGGGNGTFDGETDDIGIPNLPTLSASSTGFLTLYNPSASQLRNLANYMWSGLFDLDTYKKIFADPMSCILGLSIVPVNVPSGGSANVMVGNIDTGISMTTASSQYVEVDCGSVSVEEYWGSYLDYDPYTEIQIYLPYVGIHSLKADEVMGKSVTVKYHVDVLSGACIAYVKCGDSVLYSFLGQCASSIPITGSDWTNVINGMINIAGSIGSMVATGGASAPFALGSIASTAVNSMKPSVEKSGSLSGTGGLMGIQIPYLIITRPRQAIPEGQNRFIGYPSFITDFISNFKGYTEITEVHLEGIYATSAELTEIESILKSGVLL